MKRTLLLASAIFLLSGTLTQAQAPDDVVRQDHQPAAEPTSLVAEPTSLVAEPVKATATSNTKTYESQRPAPEKRLFRSEAVENKITSGMSDTLFAPDATCSRSQIVTFLYRMQNSHESKAENPFTDVKADAYYANAVLWAVENGVTTGASATTFDPAGDCTRGQIVTFLYRCLSK